MKPADNHNNTTSDKISQQPETKPEPIVNWENEGGNIIPTGTLPKITFPQPEEDDQQETPEKRCAA